MIKSLETWFLENKRDLPFRKTKNPYHIWISEVMLQQTQVVTVIPYYERFINKYPDIETLAKETEEGLLKMVEGLGYYRRFKLMLKAAQYMMTHHQGAFPKTYDEVIKLPGVGQYSAGAICSIAYNLPYEATDGNVIRVLSRIYAIDLDMKAPSSMKHIRSLNQSIISQANPAVYTEALMELGAMVCTPKNYACELCPVRDFCISYKQNEVDKRPVMSKAKEKENRYFKTFLIKNGQKIVLVKNEQSLLLGMYLLPQIETKNERDIIPFLESNHYPTKDIQYIKTYKHIFTHQIWHMELYLIEHQEDNLVGLIHFKDHPLPTAKAHLKIMDDLFKNQ